jgi:sugar/nucleoside kinase (ribokinase family)
MDSEAGQLDWRAILERWIPLTDIMAPSAEEVYFFLFHDRFLARKAELSDRDVLLDHMTYEEFRAIADEMLALGTAIALIKCGVRGLYVKTAPADRLEKLGAARPADVEQWADREIWSPVYEEERFVGALGSGDSAIAGFLSALVWGHSLEDCLRYGNAAGSMNVTVPDGLSWNRGFDDLTRRLDAGWAQKILDVDRDAWPCEVCRP